MEKIFSANYVICICIRVQSFLRTNRMEWIIMYKIHVMSFLNALPIFDVVGTNNMAKDIVVKVVRNK